MEDEKWSATEIGTPQGSVISPLIANLYLHHSVDLWAEQWRQRHVQGSVMYVRYADDIVAGFEYEDEARRFLEDLRKRTAKFALSLYPDKTRLIEFGSNAEETRSTRGWAGRRRSTFSALRIFARVADAAGSDAGEAQSRARGTATAQARTDPGAGSMVGACGTRFLRLPCCADQLPSPRGFSLSHWRIPATDPASS